MTDAFKILGTLVIAGFLTLAITKTSIADVATSTRQNLVFEANNSDIPQNNFVARNDRDFFTGNSNTNFVRTNNSQNNINSAIAMNNFSNTNNRQINDGIYENELNRDNQRVINGDTRNGAQSNFASSASNDRYQEIIVPTQKNNNATASVVNSGINTGVQGNFAMWALVVGLTFFAVFTYIFTTKKRNRMLPYYRDNNSGFGYYDVPQSGYSVQPMEKDYPRREPQYNTPKNVPNDITHQPQKNQPLDEAENRKNSAPEYRINLK